jgi:hypothetical protein
MKTCAKCGSRFGDKLPACINCGTEAPTRRDTDDSPSEREIVCERLSCRFPATIKVGGWTCRLHYRCPPGETERAVTAESQRWEHAFRMGDAVPETYVRHDGVVMLGFPARKEPATGQRITPPAEARERLAGIMSMLKQKPPSKQWAHELRAGEERGEPLLLVQQSAWREALTRPRMPDRIPGEDDEEIAA